MAQEYLCSWALILPGTAFATVGTTQAGFVFPSAMEFVAIRAYADTPPTGASLILNVKLNGVAVVTAANRPTIAAGANVASVVTIFSTSNAAAGDRLTVDVDQVGSTNAGGSDLYLAGWMRERST